MTNAFNKPTLQASTFMYMLNSKNRWNSCTDKILSPKLSAHFGPNIGSGGQSAIFAPKGSFRRKTSSHSLTHSGGQMGRLCTAKCKELWYEVLLQEYAKRLQKHGYPQDIWARDSYFGSVKLWPGGQSDHHGTHLEVNRFCTWTSNCKKLVMRLQR